MTLGKNRISGGMEFCGLQAMVDVARRLARTEFAMWRDETDFEPDRSRD